MKRLLTLVTVGVMAVVLTACGGGGKTKVEPNTTETSKETQTTTAKPSDVAKLEIGQPYTIKTDIGEYVLTIEKIYPSTKKNEFAEAEEKTTSVVLIDYSYQNTSFQGNEGQDLYIDEYAFQTMDGDGNMVKPYPATEIIMPVNTPTGGKCKARMAFGITSDSDTINLTFKRGNEKVANITHKFK